MLTGTLAQPADAVVLVFQLKHDEVHHFEGQPDDQRLRADNILKDVRRASTLSRLSLGTSGDAAPSCAALDVEMQLAELRARH